MSRAFGIGFFLFIACLSMSCKAVQSSSFPSAAQVKAVTQKVADWQIETFEQMGEYRALPAIRKKWQNKKKYHDLTWHNGALYAGMNEWCGIADDPSKYTDWLKMIGTRNGWNLHSRPYHADDHAVGQFYLSLYEQYKNIKMIAPTRTRFDWILANPKTGTLDWEAEPSDCHDRWGWCDALFMAPPVWARLAKITGDQKYLAFMDQEYHATYDLLWNAEDSFFWRDSSYFSKRENNGRRLYWARGNGWVFGGLALMIPDLPLDWKGRSFYIDLFNKMANSLKACQREDGTWSMGLLGGVEGYPSKETSGTSFFTFGLAWGVNNGLLDRATFAPVIIKAWKALCGCVTDEGLLGYVQPVGAAPGESFSDKTEVYGIGAFLAAGTEVYKLCKSHGVAEPVSADVVIYGGTSAAVIAAVQAKQMGKSVIIVSPDKHLGGLTSGGLGWTDTGNKEVVGGLSREFYKRIFRHYNQPKAWTFQKKSEYGNRGQGNRAMDDTDRTMWIFEPHVAEQVFEDLIVEYGIPVYRDEWLDREHGLEKKRTRIFAFTTLSGTRYRGRMFIDATYEGDLMAAAGVSYHVGREANRVYDEQWNGIQVGVLHHGHHFGTMNISPYVTPGDPTSGLLPRISGQHPGHKGQGDRRVQAYCFRMCLTNCPENRVPFSKPEHYDPAQYALLARVLNAGWNEVFDKFDPIPNHKTDTNNHGPFSTDNIGMNYAYPEGAYEQRRAIIKEHETYQKGLMYFLANDPGIPDAVRTRMSQWGLAKDEFKDNGHWPHQLYIREARRMIGEYVTTENDVQGKRQPPKPVGMGSYTMDSHNIQRYVTPEGFVQNEGDIGVHPKKPYRIDYGSITPKKAECENLLVPVCVSSSHIAFGSIRMEPVFMLLGQSASTAACLAIDHRTAVQDVDYEILKKQLLADKQRL